jgi:nicotinate-nucleotide adenylyltransferase
MDVALLGGSFNPPHLGHLLAAHVARALEPVEELWLVPAAHHPFGKPLIAFQSADVLAPARRCPHSGFLDIEGRLGGPGYTVDTLRALHRARPKNRWTLVVGSDVVPEMPRWHEIDEVRRLARIVVLHRAGHPAPEAIGPPLATVSSTEVREALEGGRGGKGLVHRAVLAYIGQHHLYAAPG